MKRLFIISEENMKQSACGETFYTCPKKQECPEVGECQNYWTEKIIFPMQKEIINNLSVKTEEISKIVSIVRQDVYKNLTKEPGQKDLNATKKDS